MKDRVPRGHRLQVGEQAIGKDTHQEELPESHIHNRKAADSTVRRRGFRPDVGLLQGALIQGEATSCLQEVLLLP